MADMLILRLEGVLQSWGLRARWDFRDSGLMPSKSGVIGLLSCCMGLSRGDDRIRHLDEELIMGVRADRPGILLEDYQTVTGERGYLYEAQGKKRVGEPTIVTPRQYLQDACFTVALQGKKSLLTECVQALKAPVWQLYLGRKSCPPSRPLFEAITDDYDTIEEALSAYPLCKRHAKGSRFYCEIEDENGSILRRDAIRRSGFNYSMRRIRWIYAECKDGD